MNKRWIELFGGGNRIKSRMLTRQAGFLTKAQLAALFLPAMTLLAQQPVLELERSSDGMNHWERIAITPEMIDSLGNLTPGVLPSGGDAFFRLKISMQPPAGPAPEGFALIQAGAFQMGDQSNPLVGWSDELPAHGVFVSAFYLAKYEVTKALWDEVRTWGETNGYTDLPAGSMNGATNYSQGNTHPVHLVDWYAVVKWCNARSEKEGLTPCYTVSGSVYKTGSSAPDCNWNANGYRLPTEAEWEKAARGGLTAKNFPWGDIINHAEANYCNGSYSYELPQYQGYHPAYSLGTTPYTSPVGSFAANGYGLCDMTGNVSEWCWDWYGESYPSAAVSNPRGPSTGTYRALRGGHWASLADSCRCSFRDGDYPASAYDDTGVRVVRSAVP